MKKMMMLVLTTALALSAAFVPVDRASKVATNQYMNYCADANTKGADIINVVENKFEGETTWYAFEFEQGGFVIVSADDAVRPILGYSDNGKAVSLDKKGGQNFKEWFNKYDREIAFMRKNGHVDAVGQKTWKDIENNVFPSSKGSIVVDALLRSEYDQVYPWNNLCPEKDGTYTYVGCVATAMVQILRYHQWPDVGVGTQLAYSPFTGYTIPLTDFTTHTWNYGLMPLTVDLEYGLYPDYWEVISCSQAEVDELALQSYWVGISVVMGYGTYDDGGSSANMTNAANALRDHWKGTCVGPTSFATPAAGGVDASYATIIAQLDLGRPWDWAGGAHSFNLDGYRNDYWYHFNWGWWGSYDGWYHRSSLIPGGIGSGGGDGDFTLGQLGITYAPAGQAAFAATVLSGSATGYTVNLSWTAQTGATGYMLFRRMNDDYTADLEYVATATGTTYQLTEQFPATYYYVAKVVYATGESKYSNIKTITVVNNPNDNEPLGVLGTVVGRTNIDVKWLAAYAGRLDWFENFNVNINMPPGWIFKAGGVAANGWLPGQTDYAMITDAGIARRNGWVETETLYALNLGNFFLLSSGFPDGNPAAVSPEVQMEGWLLAPNSVMDTGSSIKYWGRFRCVNNDGTLMNQPTEGWPVYDIVTYMGDFSEAVGVRITHRVHETKTQNSLATNNQFDREESVSLSAANGETTRAGFKIRKTTYSWCIDDIRIGTNSVVPAAPSAYKVYRNGALAYTTPDGTTLTWTDTGFADGNNSYYAYAVRSGVDSRKSNISTAYMIANPKPGFLTGTVGSYTTANLSWYAPCHNAPMWYTYMPAEECFSATYLDAETPMQKRRVIFQAQDLGYTYPITLDSIAAGFYEYSDVLWGAGNDDFVFKVYTESDSVVIHTSATQYAVHNKITTYALPTPLVINEDFNVEVQTLAATGAPWGLMGSAGDANTHSYFLYGTSYFYGISYGDGSEWAEWNHMAYMTSSAPPPIVKDGIILPGDNNIEARPAVVKSGWTTPSMNIEPKAMVLKNPRIIKDAVKGGKALTYYNIYRDDAFQSQQTSLTYQQTSVSPGDHSYAVTALYAVPPGESGYSEEDGNEITLSFGTPPVISLPASISPATDPDTSTPASFNIGNTGQAYLHYSMTNAYVGYLSSSNMTTNDFQSAIAPYTNSGTRTWALATGGTWNSNTQCAKVTDPTTGGASGTGILTSPAFNGSAYSAIILDWDQTAILSSSNIAVQYLTGTTWTSVYSSTTSVTGHQSVQIPTSATQIRFNTTLARSSGSEWSIDNVVAIGITPYSWLSFVSPTTGTVVGGGSNTINLTCNATGLAEATYEANITVTSDDPVTPTDVLNVQFIVAEGSSAPSAPTNFVTSIVGGNVLINWDDVSGASNYWIYSSDIPYGSFTLLDDTNPLSDYTYTPTESKKFFYVLSSNSKSAVAPKTIQVKRTNVLK